MAGVENGFQLVRRGALAYLQSPLLEAAGVAEHAFSTRLGGCSGGAAASLNTAFHTEDDCRSVLENRRRFLEPWGYTPEDLVAGIQVHGTVIRTVTAADRGRGAVPGNFLGECDALVTAEPGLVLTAYAADCLLLFFLAPRARVAALAHAGWRGTLGNIARNVVGYLRDHFAVNPGDLLVALSPGICARCYRVDETVASLFRKVSWEAPPFLFPAPGGGYRLDLARINKAQLLQSGIREHRLADCAWCTSCRPGLFYSYRREKGKTGRMMGFIALKPASRGKAGPA